MAKKESASCSTFSAIALLALASYIAYQVIHFFLSPGALQAILDLLRSAGICLGVVVLVFIVMSTYSILSSRLSKPKLRSMSSDFTVRCRLVESEPTPTGEPAYHSPTGFEIVTVIPIYLRISMVNFGVLIRPLVAPSAGGWVPADNARRFIQVSGDDPDPIILPYGVTRLSYILSPQEGKLAADDSPNSKESIDGPLPAALDGLQVKILLTFPSIIRPSDLGHIVSLAQPIHISLVALDEGGLDDQSATCELYNTLYQRFQPPDDSGEDNSWMYRSRPIYW